MAFNRSPPGSNVQGFSATVTGLPKTFKCGAAPTNQCGGRKKNIRGAQMAFEKYKPPRKAGRQFFCQ
jgi:hypothetical protein